MQMKLNISNQGVLNWLKGLRTSSVQRVIEDSVKGQAKYLFHSQTISSLFAIFIRFRSSLPRCYPNE
jgi:hypothetical protein